MNAGFYWSFVALSFAARAAAQQPLQDLFRDDYLLADRNGDGVVDFVNAELVLGSDPESPVLAAAADLASRLGFETMAMDLPLRRDGGGVAIAVGAGAASVAGVSLEGLAADEGVVAATRRDGREFLVVAGTSAAGTRAAALLVAGRLPHLFHPDGPTLTDVLVELREVLTAGTVEPESIDVTRLVARRESLASMEISVGVPPEQAPLARRLLLDHAPSYRGVEAIVLRIGDDAIRLPRLPEDDAPGPVPGRPGSGAKRTLDLSNLYTPDGLLGDSDSNHIPDRVDAVLSPASPALGIVDLAARLGLESSGITLPVVRLPEEIESASEEPTLVLIGEHPLLQEEDLPPPVPLADGEGAIRVVPGAFGAKSAVLVSGRASGLERAMDQLAVTFPHVRDRGPDRTTLDDVEMDVWRFLSGRSPAGQAAAALYKLDRIVADLAEERVGSARVIVSLSKPAPGLEVLVRERASDLGAEALEVVIDDRDVENAATIFDERFTIPSEVSTLRELFRERALPRLRGRREQRVLARVSEPPEVRLRLEEEIRQQLDDGAEVRVLSAYKQGYSWLYDAVRPELERLGARRVMIRFARYRPPAEWPQQAMHTELRWLHEAFPIDEILARELGLELGDVVFEMAPDDAPAYEVIALDGAGEELFRESFEPKRVLRPYLDRFRDYEMVGVTTGWIHASAEGETVLDQRIETDPERFWNHFQQTTIPAMYDYVMSRHEGNPRGDGRDAPYFGELEVELSLSEPHYLLDLDKELIAPMDALHEDIYFTTLMFFRILGRNARGDELTYPGRILPIMEPRSHGGDGEARIRFTGFATSRPAVVVELERDDGVKRTARLDVPKIDIERPRALTAVVRAGTPGLHALQLRVKVDTERDERDALIERARAEQVDERILSADQVYALVENLEALRELYPEALAYHGLERLEIAAGVAHEVDWENERLAAVAPGRPAPSPDIAAFDEPEGDAIVQWDTPIPPGEAYGILARMARYPEATVYKMGESYLGQDIWAMDLMPPVEASHFSRMKATTLKPTIVYSARQHANEVSSTSHVLKLAELLLTDPAERAKLDAVNVVIHPITNADGAQLAYDLYRRTPELILHAGYYASLGMDVTSDGNQPMPIYPESTVRRRLWERWLPDIFLNPHGYPSHQLVQLFSEYTGLVRRGRVTERNWSMNKGWFMPGFSYIDDPRFPRHKDAAFEIRDYITRAINDVPEVFAMNQRNYERYRRYGAQFDDDDVFKLPMVDDVLIHTAIEGSPVPSPGSSRGYDPKITIWSGTTEAPDETAHGEWMRLVASAGLAWDRAILNYLVDGDHAVERKGSEFFGGLSLSLDRPRPPKQADDEEQPE